MRLVHIFDDTENEMNPLCGMAAGSDLPIVIKLEEHLIPYDTDHFKGNVLEDDYIQVNLAVHITLYDIIY